MYFNELFQVDEPDQYDWFNPILERDTLLFVDPFLLFSDGEEKWRHAHDRMMDHFHQGLHCSPRLALIQIINTSNVS